MESIADINELMTNQDSLRKKLFVCWVNNPIARRKMALDIGMSQLTLKRFLDMSLDVHMRNLIKIKNYLDKKDKQ